MTVLQPGATVLVVRDLAAFTARFGVVPNIAGAFIGALDSNGENLRLEDAAGEKILEFEYNNSWYPVTDGLGFSLVVRDESTPWDRMGRSSELAAQCPVRRFAGHGGPGATDSPCAWSSMRRWRIPIRPRWIPSSSGTPARAASTSVAGSSPTTFSRPGNIVCRPEPVSPRAPIDVFSELQFNPQPGVDPSFAFNSTGDEVFLFAGDASSNLVGTYHGFEFGASPNGVAFGRYTNSQGEEQFVLASANTPGATNAPALVGPVVLSEIMYHPPDLAGPDNDLDEYLELRNMTTTNVPLHALAHPTNTWRLRKAVEFDFPQGVTLPPGGHLLVVGFDPADAAVVVGLSNTYQLSAAIPVLGPWAGKLDNSGEAIELQRPDNPNTNMVPYLLVEKVAYRDDVPWPANADGLGNSLQRQPVAALGTIPRTGFVAHRHRASQYSLNLPPTVALTSPVTGSSFVRPLDLPLSATASDSDGQITRVEFYNHSTKLGEDLTAPYTFLWTNVPAGSHLLTRAPRTTVWEPPNPLPSRSKSLRNRRPSPGFNPHRMPSSVSGSRRH